jgi:hypothetical protein
VPIYCYGTNHSFLYAWSTAVAVDSFSETGDNYIKAIATFFTLDFYDAETHKNARDRLRRYFADKQLRRKRDE